jgi:exosortase
MSSSVAAVSGAAEGVKTPRLQWPPLAIIGVAWLWTFHAFSQYWVYLPQYAYGWLVPFLGAFFFWRRLSIFAAANPMSLNPPKARDTAKSVFLLVILCAAITPLELARQRSPLSRTLVWVIGANAVAITLLTLGWMGGRKLRKAMIFPTCFLLISAPWLSVIEQPVVAGLAERVSGAITEILHWLGFIAHREGTVIAMKPGRVGIDEACSGIRSLQSGIMYGIAIGELFLLTVPRRWLMVFIAFSGAIMLNLSRTLILCWAVDKEGLDVLGRHHSFLGMDHTIHDWVGGFVSLGLPVIVWVSGRWLNNRPTVEGSGRSAVVATIGRPLKRLGTLKFAAVLAAVGFIGVEGWSIAQELRIGHQTRPYLVLNSSIRTNEPAQTVMDTLEPTTGVNFQQTDPRIRNGILGYQFFWKPSAGSIFILGHRPDVCMTGAGYVIQREPQKVQIKIGDRDLSWYSFQFKNRDTMAIQIWGVWRDGRPVDINYDRKSFDRGTAVPWLQEAGDRKSAMEIVSLVFYYEGEEPTIEVIGDIINKMFSYRRPEDSAAK